MLVFCRRLFCFCVCSVFLSAAVTMAEDEPPLGWVPKEDLPQTDSVPGSVPGYCAGGFVSPLADTDIENPDHIDIRADQVFRDSERLGLQGNVVILDEDLVLKTQLALYYPDKNYFDLSAGFELAGYTLLAAGQRADYYADTESLSAQELRFALPGLHAWGNAGNLRATRENGNARIEMEEARISFCDPTENSWHLRARRLDLNRATGQGKARGVRFFAGRSAVMALPFLQFPLGDARQSGLLFPTFNVNSRSGFVYSQPFYVNIRPNLDTTFYAHALSERGFLLEQELRWLTPAGDGTVGYGYLHRDAREQKRRVAQHFRFDSVVRNGWSGDVSLNAVSDADYLRDLPAFFEAGDDFSLPSDARVRYDSKSIHWSFGFRSDQLLAEMTDTANRTRTAPYRQLPYTRFSYLGNLGYGFSWFQNSEYILFGEPAGSPEVRSKADPEVYTGNNARLFNELSLLWTYARQGGFLKTNLFLEDIRYRFSATEQDGAESALSRSGFYLDGKPIFSAPSPVCDCYVTLEPRFYALYAERQRTRRPTNGIGTGSGFGLDRTFDTARQFPNYDALFDHRHYIGGDYLASEQRFAVGAESRLINLAGGEEYRLRLARAFYLTDRELTSGEQDQNNSFSPWVFDLAWFFPYGGYLETRLVQEDGAAVNRHITGHATDRRSYDISVSYYGRENTFYQDKAEQWGAGVVWQVHNKWSVLNAVRYDVPEREWASLLTGFSYENCCLRIVNGLYEQRRGEELETGIVLRFVFKPWGSIGVNRGLTAGTEEIYNSILFGISR